jgi:hypothetical protein
MSQTKETFGYMTAEELSQMKPVHGDSRIIISYDKETVEGVVRTTITEDQYAEIKKRVENDDALWQHLFDVVEQVGSEVLEPKECKWCNQFGGHICEPSDGAWVKPE